MLSDSVPVGEDALRCVENGEMLDRSSKECRAKLEYMNIHSIKNVHNDYEICYTPIT